MKAATRIRTCISRGFSMIEMLVGVLIISFGLLGLISLQSRALQASVSSEDAQRAALLASELAATMMNANTVALNQTVIDAWVTRVQAALPAGTGEVTTPSGTTNTRHIKITWRPPHAASGVVNDTHNYATDVVIP